MQHRDEDSEPTAAERAFEALRAEVAGIRQALRSLPELILKNQPADYTETLGAIAKKLEIVGNFMAAIEHTPRSARHQPTITRRLPPPAKDSCTSLCENSRGRWPPQ